MPFRMKGLLDDRLIGALGALTGAVLFLLTPYAVRTSTALIPGTDILFIRGDFYPRVTAGLLVVTGLWLLVSDWLRSAAGRPIEEWPGKTTTAPEFAGAFAFLATSALYVFIIINVGFAVASVVIFFALARVLGGKTVPALVLAVVSTVLMELVFSRFFGIPLPGRLLS